MKTIMELKNINKTYGNITALEQINLDLLKGEVLSLLGPNGSGKTTLVRIMAGIEKPTSGEMRFNGVKVDEGNINKVRLKTTMVFQKTALFNTSVYKNIAYGLRLRGYSKRETDEKVEEALKTVQLEGYEKRPAKKLSGGEQQRVALARALTLDTDVLLLDEPTANIDPKNVSIIEEALAWLSKEKKTTMVIATHNMFQAETLATRVALLLGGKIAQIGAPKEIFRGPSESLVSFTRLENVFSGTSRVLQEGTSVISVDDGMQIEAALGKSGKVTVFVRPEDIILSKEAVASSARNVFKGKIVEISDFGPTLKLKVDVGKEFVVQITRRSFVEMQLNVGSTVFLTFKASSVHLI